jgi:hypothetical protein
MDGLYRMNIAAIKIGPWEIIEELFNGEYTDVAKQ